jgi:putative DNA methylase
VDDPSSLPEQFPTEADQDKERQRLFRLIEKLVLWENSNNRAVLDEAHAEILKSTDGNPPPIYDPFCGGGSIPLEAQRLGLEAHGSDLNPVAVLITKALIEIPPKFAGQPPVNPAAKKKMSGKGMWTGARGLADDVRYYGQWMRDRAFERIGRLYPKVTVPKEHGGGEATVIAWLWARTVKCPNPACGAQMPLVRSFTLSTKKGKQSFVKCRVDHATKTVEFEVTTENDGTSEGTVNRRGAKCVVCGSSVPLEYIRAEGRAGRMGNQMTSVVAEGHRRRLYLSPAVDQLLAVCAARPLWKPDGAIAYNPGHTNVFRYGLVTFGDLFTARQLATLELLCALAIEVRTQARADGADAARADAIATYMALAVDRLAMTGNSIVRWNPVGEKAQHAFGRQALPMVWDFAEPNFFADATGSISAAVDLAADSLDFLCGPPAFVKQIDAAAYTVPQPVMNCTDPPYYDNIGYGDLSDFFYVWLRRSINTVYPDLFSTLLVPKAQELVAAPHRFGGDKEQAQSFFETGLAKAFLRMRESQHPGYPVPVFYAFKQSETEEDEDAVSSSAALASTGWETMLEGLTRAEFQITGTWPMRTEMKTRQVAMDSNALASSIVLVCRSRPQTAGITTRKDFLASLKKELPQALRNLQKGNIAPVDLAQAAIGPGMAVFSRYKKVLETDGSPMRVRTALALINQGLDEVLSELESEFDPDTRWALAWFEQHQFDDGLYGEAEVLATAKALSISHLAEAGMLHSRAGKVRLLRREELPEGWDPSTVGRLTVWEVTQHLIRCLDQKGEKETANLKSKIGGMAEIARDLAYRLYTLCERKGWAEEAGYYNSLVVAWPSMASEAFELR